MAFDPDKFLAETAPPQAAQGGFDPDAFLAETAPKSGGVMAVAKGIGNAALGAVEYAGKKYDQFIAGPTRAVISEELQNGLQGKPISAALGAMWNPDNTPSGDDIARQMGVSNKPVADSSQGTLDSMRETAQTNWDPEGGLDAAYGMANLAKNTTRAQAVGGAIQVGADAGLILPVGQVLKGGAEIGGKALNGIVDLTKATSRGAANVADAALGGTRVIDTVDTAGKAAGYLGESAKNTYNAAINHIFSPKQAEDFGEYLAIAKKNGIDPALLPESVEFGKGSFIDTASRARREGPLGEQYKEAFNQGLRQVQGAVDQKISKIGGAPPMSSIEAGQALRSSYNDGLTKFFDSIDMTHDEVQKYAPGLFVDHGAMAKIDSTVSGIEKFAKGRLERGIAPEHRAQAQELLNAVSAFRSGNGSYKQTVEALRDIGDVAFKKIPGKQIPSDQSRLQKMYFAIDDGLIETVRKHVNPQFADELQANNKAMSEMFKNKDQVASILSDHHIAPETAFNRVVMSGDSDQIKALQKILSPEAFDQQRAAFLNNLIKRDADGSFNLSTLYSAMQNKQNQLKTLFADRPDVLLEIGELTRLGDRFGKAVLSTSGTGASNVFNHLSSSIKEGAISDTMINSLKDKARSKAAQGANAPLVPLPGSISPLQRVGKVGQTMQATPPERGVANDEDPIQRRLNSGRR